MVARRAVQARLRLVAPVQGEAGQVVGEAVVGVGLDEAGANDSVQDPSASPAVCIAAFHVSEGCGRAALTFQCCVQSNRLPGHLGVFDLTGH